MVHFGSCCAIMIVEIRKGEPLSVQLEVSVGELLSGKRIEAEQYQKETEQILLDAV